MNVKSSTRFRLSDEWSFPAEDRTSMAEAWQEAGVGRVIGLTTSTNAAHALAAEGLAETYNFAEFLGRIRDSDQTCGHLPVLPGDLLVVDEASMVPTADLAAVEAIATRRGAKILLNGDTAQLSAPQAGGALRLLAGEHGYYQLHTVQRFEQEWERAASLRLRSGDYEVLAEYDQRGRILDGTREQMADAACQRWLADHLSGNDSVLLATTNAQAAELGRRARDELAALGLVARDDLAELADGNVAGVGDFIVARHNERIAAGEPGRRLANRDVLRIDAWAETGEERFALVRRITGRDPLTGQVAWSAPFELPEDYLEQHADLAYAGNVYVAQGRTVGTAHLVVDGTARREALYLGMSRGRERNTAYVVTERVHAADLSPDPRPAPDLEDPAASEDPESRPHRLAVLAGVLEREQAEATATETMRHELEQAASLATLAPMWADVTRTHATRQYEHTIRSRLPSDEWHRYQQDAERGTLTRLLRAADLAGHDVYDVLRRTIERRDFAGAHSIAAVLHGRVQRIVGTPEPQANASYLDRTPVIEDPGADRFARKLAAAMDERVSLLGNRAAMDRPIWALRYLGEVPADPLDRADWVRRAGAAAAYREERGYADETEAIGPAPERASPEQRASWHAAYAALRLPEHDREVASAADGELWARRVGYERETKWAPPYVVDELREAHLAEDAYRADAVRAWHRADAAADGAERAQARQEAEQSSALAQEVGTHREALAEVAEARRAWHAATELDRQRALMADTELRRRHPDAELPPLHPDEEPQRDPDAGPIRDESHIDQRAEPIGGRQGEGRRDLKAALAAARRAQKIIAERERQGDREADVTSDDLMRRREAEAQQEAAARRTAVRQHPLASRRTLSLERDEPELEAGQ
jgi:AAA domain